MILLLFAFAAGIVTVLAPCILPVLPLILSGGSIHGRARPWGIITGVIISFSLFTLALSWLVQHFGLSPNLSRIIGIILLLLLGVIMLVPRWLEQFEGWASNRLHRDGKTAERTGFFGGLLLGFSLGAVWTPCAGPILASVTVATQSGQIHGTLIAVTVVYAIGAALPMGLIAALGQQLIKRIRWIKRHSGRIQQTFGIIILVMVALIATGTDRRVQAAIIQHTPAWLPNLQRFEARVDTTPMMPTSASINDPQLGNYGMAPEFSGLTNWINSKPLTLQELRGHVVLVKFWTYSCINCIRTLPYVQAWYDKYHDQGLEIIAVHSPEFGFEADPNNVAKAVKDFKITYPVALDNSFSTWRAYQNQYWPAKYFIDAQGRIRYAHFGEGDYDTSERVIQKLLAEAGKKFDSNLLPTGLVPTSSSTTPETYFGGARAERFASPEPVSPNAPMSFSFPADLKQDNWALKGQWTITDQYAVAGENAALQMHINAKNVYFVMAPAEAKETEMKVLLDGQPVDINVTISVTTPNLYRIVTLPTAGSHLIEVQIPHGGIHFYAATFGSDEAPGMTCQPNGTCTINPIQ